ncbi:MAG TPA: PIN domain nuclease [Rhizobiales bacterium]|nr:PIN domain nuclease [Hyphomicrobiales bacterium]
MILADTSVWVDFFASRLTPQVARLREAVVNREILMGDLILVELLQGVRRGTVRREVERKLGPIRCEVMCRPRLAPVAAANYRRLRENGIAIRGIVDVIIATWCIENRVQLLHSDRDFEYLERHLDLPVWR